MSLLKALPAAALLFLPSSAATVHSVSVVPSFGKTEVVIGVNAAVEVQDFTLDAPARVVVDLKGATLDMRYRTYDKVSRGGITNIRYAQYRPDIVRVVIELDAKHTYEVKRNAGEVRISVTGGKTTEYSSWSSASSRKYYAAAPTPPVRQVATTTNTNRPAPAAQPAARLATPRTATPRTATLSETKAVAQVETSTAQTDVQDDPAPAPAEPMITTRATPIYAQPVALFSPAQQSQQSPMTVTLDVTDTCDVMASF